jgi:TPR repeat protein
MARKHRNHTVKKHRMTKKQYHTKKRSGGMLPASSSKKSKPKPNPPPTAMVLYRPPGGMDREMRLRAALSSPNSGIGKKLTDQLFKPPSTFPQLRRVVDESMHSAMSSVDTKGMAKEMYERAERLRATSFRSQNVAECRQTNQDAAELLNQATKLGSLKARACLADMLLNGTTLGIAPNFNEVNRLLIDEAYPEDPDCKGVLAHYYLRMGYYYIAAKRDIVRHAAKAAAGSKYGQLVIGLIELETNPAPAFVQFDLAAEQNYDQAQVALGELWLGATPPNQGEALRLFERAALQGNIHAFYLIANMHKKNAQDAQDITSYREAVKWFTFRKEAGCQIAQNDLAELKLQFPHD